MKLLFLLLPTIIMAQEFGVPDSDPLLAIGQLIITWGSIPHVMKGAMIVMILVQVMKQVRDFKHKRIVVTVLSVIYGVLDAIVGGHGIGKAIVNILFAGGGAVAIYEALKPLLRKIKFLKIGKDGQ